MSKFLRYSFGQIAGNTATRVVVFVFLLIAGLTLTMVVLSYKSQVKNGIENEFSTLRASTRSLAMNLNGEVHQSLMGTYRNIDDITSRSMDSDYALLSTQLERLHDVMELESDIYTIVKNEATAQFEFAVTSSKNPYFRHVWNHPHVEHVTRYDIGAEIGPYEDENGVWLSSFSPIKVKGKTVAIVQADVKFDEFLAKERAAFQELLFFYAILFVIATLILLKMINHILSKEIAQNKLVRNQASELEIKNKDIMSSIRVAKRLQEASLPALSAMKNDIPDLVVMYEPKDIVSGDFYWHEKLGVESVLSNG